MIAQATNLDDFLDWLAINAPRALLLDFWCRLEQAIDHYFRDHLQSSRPKSRHEIEETIASDPQLGPALRREVARLRLLRNRVAHGPAEPVLYEDAVSFGRQTHAIAWSIALREVLPGALPELQEPSFSSTPRSS